MEKSIPQSKPEDTTDPSAAVVASSEPTKTAPTTRTTAADSAAAPAPNVDAPMTSSTTAETTTETTTPSPTPKKRKDNEGNAVLPNDPQTSTFISTTPKAEPTTTPTPPSTTEKIDVATQLGLKNGDRLEVYWTICDDVSDNEEENAKSSNDNHNHNNNTDEDKKEVATMWWAASIVSNTGRMHVLTEEDLDEDETTTANGTTNNNNNNNATIKGREQDTVKIPIYELNYDPMERYGYPDHSIEEVCFISDHILLNLSTQEMMTFKREGATTPPMSPRRDDDQGMGMDFNDNDNDNNNIAQEFSSEEEVRAYMDTVIQMSFARTGSEKKMKLLSAANQRVVAEKIRKAKEQMLEKMMGELERMESGKKVLTGEVVKRCMAEMGGL